MVDQDISNLPEKIDSDDEKNFNKNDFCELCDRKFNKMLLVL